MMQPSCQKVWRYRFRALLYIQRIFRQAVPAGIQDCRLAAWNNARKAVLAPLSKMTALVTQFAWRFGFPPRPCRFMG